MKSKKAKMNEKLSIYYDKEGDLLELHMGQCTEGRFKNLGNGVFQRVDERTKDIEDFEQKSNIGSYSKFSIMERNKVFKYFGFSNKIEQKDFNSDVEPQQSHASLA